MLVYYTILSLSVLILINANEITKDKNGELKC